ncbi:MAG: O-antigen translocase [Clostridia bacterium]|nr:O-antigen translocase [Clostridia bacterium]
MSENNSNSAKIAERSAYRSIFKATSLFGGVQVFNILIQIIKQKFIAILLGPTGMGISGLYLSATQLIQGLTSMGLAQSAIKNVAEANGTGDKERISRVVSALRKLVWITGLLGMVLVIVLSPFLSKSTFGNYDYTIPFIFLSVTLLIQQLSAGQKVVLQGMRRLKHLAKSGVLGSFFGLVISVPIYYYFGIQGIVPTLILSATTTLLLTWYFSRKVDIKKITLTPKETFQEGKDMLKMGIVLSLSSILVLGVAYIVRIFIVRIGGTEEVGLYTAGFAIVNGYVGLVFTAMGTDYYPRLASVNKDNIKSKLMINQQAEIAILIIAPIIMFFLLIAPYAITLLYSEKFIPITGFMQWAMLGMIFKAAAWAIAFQFIAKGEMKIYAINETIANINILAFNLLGYYLWGLEGLGIAFAFSFLIYLFQVYFVARYKYNFNFTPSFLKLYSIQLMLLLSCFLLIYLWKSNYVYIPTVLLTTLCVYFSFKELDKRMDLVAAFKSSKSTRNKK